MDETFVGDDIAVRRVTGYLERMAIVIKEFRGLLLDMKQNIDPQFFYERLRPWFRGLDEDPWNKGRTWVFEGRNEVEGWTTMDEVAGASAGQSSLIQAFDIFLDIDVDSPQTSHMPHPSGKSFSERMRAYMPRHHRAFLNHLRANPRPLRDFVLKATQEGCDAPILEVYNGAVKAVKEFRDAHMIIVTLYIIGPAKRSQTGGVVTVMEYLPGLLEKETELERTKEMESTFRKNEKEGLRGTGGTDLVKFLKGLRDQTARSYLPQ
jgi:indoleamine 2,3-dioxygenase